tara:strand:+ start:758 stop:1039 length:282 start_codon:yes stop_codon:yes gene_type:complete
MLNQTLRQALRSAKIFLPSALYFDILLAMRNFELAQTESWGSQEQRMSLQNTFDVALRMLRASSISDDHYCEIVEALSNYLQKNGEIELSLSI